MDIRKLIHLAARVYPAHWRQRYGVEFAALLDDSGANTGIYSMWSGRRSRCR